MGFAALRPRILAVSVFLVLGLHVPVFAQFDASTPPAHISYLDGGISVEREGVSQAAAVGEPFLPGDRLVSSLGRAEILFPDGSALHVDEQSSVELLSSTLLRLTAGRVLLLVAGATDPANALSYQVDTPAASVVTEGPGDYRITVLAGGVTPDTELAVIRGWATLATDLQSIELQAGEQTIAQANGVPLSPRAFNSARFDAFATWSLVRRSSHASSGLSAQYLPRDLRMYGNQFDQNGTWEYEDPYGYVWYPAVSADWRPYYHGYWASFPTYGWTWVGLDPWAWPTHHYGRWGFARSRWYWIPGRVWGAAWVHWATAPGFVTWCPLGFDNRPVFSFAVTTGFGWVTVPRHTFGKRGLFVHQQFVNHRWSGFDQRTVIHNAAPATPQRAVRTEPPARHVAIPAAAAPRHVAIPRRTQPSTAATVNRSAPAGGRETAASVQAIAPERGRVALPRGADRATVAQPAPERQVWQPRAIPRSRSALTTQPAPAAPPPAVERAPLRESTPRAVQRSVPRASAPSAPAVERSAPRAAASPPSASGAQQAPRSRGASRASAPPASAPAASAAGAPPAESGGGRRSAAGGGKASGRAVRR